MPYIPDIHKAYGLLPYSSKHGGEVFSYPDLTDLDDDVAKLVDPRGESRVSRIIPYGYASYDDYYAVLRLYSALFPELADRLATLEAEVRRMNIKENWSVCRFVGLDGPDYGLTRGQAYYWPCSLESPRYEGVVDDEEFTSYLYPCDPDAWQILEDPTGMAARALAGDADTISFWYSG